MSRIEVWVPGIPAPGGSKRAFRHATTGKIVVMDDAKGNKPWRDRVASFALEARGAGVPPFDVPLSVSFHFVFPRPRGHYGTGRNVGRLRSSAPRWPAGRPDTTKLIRAAEDACIGILWSDDALIVDQQASKTYGDEPGLVLTVEPAI
jgi:Holliday junction resolvase RusA-like endonuclease